MSNRNKLAALDTRIAKLQAERVLLAAKVENEVDPASLQGKAIQYTLGRGDSLRTASGTVLGVSFPAEGKKGAPIVRVLAGQGADSRIDNIFVSAITGVLAPVEADPTTI
jgi:hypothetical protein